MAFNPKAKTIGLITPKDITKKAIDKIAAKFNSPAKMCPCFIDAAHTFPDKTVGALFIFGKIKQYKAAIKDLKGNEQVHGFCYVTLDEKGVPTLNISPTKGKLDAKESVMKKAMKDAFTPAYSQFKFVAPITEEQAAAMEAAAENESDEEEVSSEAAPTVSLAEMTANYKNVLALFQKVKAKDQSAVAPLQAESTKFVNNYAKLSPADQQAAAADYANVSKLLKQLPASGSAATASTSTDTPERAAAKKTNTEKYASLVQLLKGVNLDEIAKSMGV